MLTFTKQFMIDNCGCYSKETLIAAHAAYNQKVQTILEDFCINNYYE